MKAIYAIVDDTLQTLGHHQHDTRIAVRNGAAVPSTRVERDPARVALSPHGKQGGQGGLATSGEECRPSRFPPVLLMKHSMHANREMKFMRCARAEVCRTPRLPGL